MRELTFLKPEVKDKLRTNIFSAVDVANKQLVSHLIIHSLNFYETFVFVSVGTTSKAKLVTSVEIMCLCRLINDVLLKLDIITLCPCRFISVDFDECVFNLAFDL